MSLNESSSSERLQSGGSAYLPGCALHPIMRRAARATSRQWCDAIVEEVHASGQLQLRSFEDGRVIRVWNFLDNTNVIAVGDPVAVHSRFGVLTAGGVTLSVRFV